MHNKQMTDHDEAEVLAINALAFIAQDSELLPRFLDLTGIKANDIRTAASTKGFLAGVLSFLLNHEPTLLKFVESSQYAPEAVAQAFALLPGGAPRDS